jgi:5-methylcytosine-specific restriction endonuclease McrA
MTSCQKYCKKCNAYTERYTVGTCKICVRAKNNAWAARNRETLNAKCRQWNADNADSKRATNAKYRSANKGLINERRKVKRLLDPSLERNKSAKRRAAKGILPKDIVKRLLVLQQWKCRCCGESLESGYHLDHIIPLSRGGTNSKENVQLLLPKCNQQKYTLTMEEFLIKRRNNPLHIETNNVINTP